MTRCAEKTLLRDDGLLADLYRGDGIKPGIVADPRIIADLDPPGKTQARPGMHEYLLAYLTPENFEQPPAKTIARQWRKAKQGLLAEEPQENEKFWPAIVKPGMVPLMKTVEGHDPLSAEQLPLLASFPLLFGDAIYWTAQNQLGTVRGMNVAGASWSRCKGSRSPGTPPRIRPRWKPSSSATAVRLIGPRGLWETAPAKRVPPAVLTPGETLLAAPDPPRRRKKGPAPRRSARRSLAADDVERAGDPLAGKLAVPPLWAYGMSRKRRSGTANRGMSPLPRC